MINFDYITNENIKELNSNWPEIPDHPYNMLIVGGSESEKTAQPAHNSLRTSSNGPTLVETSRTIIRPK